jgi:hypothetical protein
MTLSKIYMYRTDFMKVVDIEMLLVFAVRLS